MLNEAALIATLLKDGVVQYPDQKVYQAAMMLLPNERPTVPVRFDGQFRNDTVGAYVPLPTRDTIFVNRDNEVYKKDRLPQLAAAIAHEQTHVARKDTAEAPAYQQQYETLKRLQPHNYSNLERLKRLAESWMITESRHHK